MVFWSLVIAITAIACAALYYAASGRTVNASAGVTDTATEDDFRLRLGEIGADMTAGRLAPTEGEAARGELAREYLRVSRDAAAAPAARTMPALAVPVTLILAAALAFVTYGYLGRPDLPAQPLSARVDALGATLDLNAAMDRIERQLADHPDDLRGWTVIAPAYVEAGRYADAETAYRRVLALAPPTADVETDLAEVLLLGNGGEMTGEPLALLESAAARDPLHIRSRFYLAGDATRRGDNVDAHARWTALLALAKGDEPWIAAAREGLAVSQEGLSGDAPALPDAAAIAGMVEGLNTRLLSEGGNLDEWTRLVRSQLVLGDTEAAQVAYDAAVAAFPDANTRGELDTLAAAGNLVLQVAGP